MSLLSLRRMTAPVFIQYCFAIWSTCLALLAVGFQIGGKQSTGVSERFELKAVATGIP